jgi:hypothetical protein
MPTTTTKDPIVLVALPLSSLRKLGYKPESLTQIARTHSRPSPLKGRTLSAAHKEAISAGLKRTAAGKKDLAQAS